MKIKSVLILSIFICLLFSCSQVTTVKPGSYLEININDPVINNVFMLRSMTMEIFKVIERAKQDENINGIVLNIGSISRSRDFLWELRTVLQQFKASGKNIVAYISNADLDVYMLASVADKIVMDELGIITMHGYSVGRGYVSQILENFGIGVKELRYFEYKSAAESYTRTNMSEADRRQYTEYLDDVFDYTRSILIDARGWTGAQFDSFLNRDFMHSAASALSFNLIDYIGRENAVREAIAELEGKENTNYCLYGSPETRLMSNDGLQPIPQRYTVPRVRRGEDIIALVYAEGETDMTRGIGISRISKIITDLADNNNVKAIVVRINSPGGSAQAADALAEAINYARSKKPVVVSMGDLAASGGYWASLTASHIMATPYTMTGSIGVISSWFYDNGMYNKLGLTVDVIKRGEHSDLFTGFLIPYRNLSALEEDQYKQYILNIYDIFINKVAVGRNMDVSQVEAAAQGRVYSGIRALDVGLIDSIGSLSDAMNLACELAGIANDTVNYREYPEPGFMDYFMSSISFTGIEANNSNSIFDMFFPDAGINYRLENNGQVMPILPLEFSIR